MKYAVQVVYYNKVGEGNYPVPKRFLFLVNVGTLDVNISMIKQRTQI